VTYVVGGDTHADESHWFGQERFPGKVRSIPCVLQS